MSVKFDFSHVYIVSYTIGQLLNEPRDITVFLASGFSWIIIATPLPDRPTDPESRVDLVGLRKFTVMSVPRATPVLITKFMCFSELVFSWLYKHNVIETPGVNVSVSLMTQLIQLKNARYSKWHVTSFKNANQFRRKMFILYPSFLCSLLDNTWVLYIKGLIFYCLLICLKGKKKNQAN